MKIKLNLTKRSTSREMPQVVDDENPSMDDALNDLPPVDPDKAKALTGLVPGQDNTRYRAPKGPAAEAMKQAQAEDTVREASKDAVDGKKAYIDKFTHDSVSNEEYVNCGPKTQATFQEIFGNVFGDIFGGHRRAVIQQIPQLNGPAVESVSRAKSPKAKARSQMLKMVMPELSSEQGDRLMQAMQDHDDQEVKRIFAQIGAKLSEKVKRKKN